LGESKRIPSGIRVRNSSWAFKNNRSAGGQQAFAGALCRRVLGRHYVVQPNTLPGAQCTPQGDRHLSRHSEYPFKVLGTPRGHSEYAVELSTRFAPDTECRPNLVATLRWALAVRPGAPRQLEPKLAVRQQGCSARQCRTRCTQRKVPNSLSSDVESGRAPGRHLGWALAVRLNAGDHVRTGTRCLGATWPTP
jgi:hypothetical protein